MVALTPEDEFINDLQVYFDTKFEDYTKKRIVSYLEKYKNAIPAQKPLTIVKEKKVVIFREINTKKVLSEAGEIFQTDYNDIIRHVIDFTGVKNKDLVSKSRIRDYVAARHVAMHMIRDLCGLNTVQIGKLFRRDHSSVIHAIAKVKSMIEVEDKKYTDIISYVSIKLFNADKKIA